MTSTNPALDFAAWLGGRLGDDDAEKGVGITDTPPAVITDGNFVPSEGGNPPPLRSGGSPSADFADFIGDQLYVNQLREANNL